MASRPEPSRPRHAAVGAVLCAFGGYLSVWLLRPLRSLLRPGHHAPLGRDDLAVSLVVGFCGLALLLIGIGFLLGKFTVFSRGTRTATGNARYPCRGVYLTASQIQQLEARQTLPNLHTPVFLRPEETAVYHSRAVWQTVRPTRRGETPYKSAGAFVITSERIVFLSEQKGFELAHTEITAATACRDGFLFQSGGVVYALVVSRADLATLAFDGVRTGQIPIAPAPCADPPPRPEAPTPQTEPAAQPDKMPDIADIDGMEGHHFEYFCAALLQQNGFSDVRVTKGSGDQGVDVFATKGGVHYAIQCKNYASPLGNKPIQAVNAGKAFYRCHVGVVMTNSTFTPGAKDLAEATGVLLWDRAVLQTMLSGH